jgi:SAM-dependent methyltransferase
MLLSRILHAHMRKQPGELNILDWGCGKGHITYLLQREGFVVTACDRYNDSDDSAFGQSAPIIAELDIPVVPLQDDVQLPFESASFDCVTSFGVLEHVPRDSDSLREIRRVLRPGGVFYVTFLPYPSSWTQAVARARGDGYHDRLYWRRRLRALAATAGFTVQWVQLAQLFPKNSVPLGLDPLLEKVDRALCRFTPLKYLATNLEAVLTAP